MTVKYERPDGVVVTLPPPGMFYNSLPAYRDDEIVAELRKRELRIARGYTEGQRLPVDCEKLDRGAVKKLREELARRGIVP